ncbi:DUF6867 family protein [Emcibacter sp. SYSU 3D8]|uniref:DUF6867 family protein n=1 Tax=Emcibacter sp. SYSU 3D8 TaxID=3133969 RepID=UPI0031FEFEBD
MTWQMLFGTSPSVSLAVTGIFMAGCAIMAGRSLAALWRPWWHVAPYAALLAIADRYLIYALFGGELLSAIGYLLDAVFLLIIALLGYLEARAGLMVRQYPWLFERLGPFAWRRRRAR